MAVKKNELVRSTKPWSYEDAVRTGQELVKLDNKITLDLAREIYAAHEVLSNPGARTDLTSVQVAPRCNDSKNLAEWKDLSPWEKYCSDIGISRWTANRYLKLYVPKEDKLLTPEEFKARKILEFESWIKKLDPKFPDWRPEGWPPGCEQYYQGKLREKFLLDLSRREKFEQLELFNAAYMKNLADSIVTYTTEDVIRFSEVSKKIEPIAYPGVPVRDQAKAFMVVEKVLERFAAADRKSVARAIAEMTALYAQEED